MAEKKLPGSPEAKRTLIERAHPQISFRRQCQLLGLNRSRWYYQPAAESADNLHLMRLITNSIYAPPSMAGRA